jgi:hypothetical protein
MLIPYNVVNPVRYMNSPLGGEKPQMGLNICPHLLSLPSPPHHMTGVW